MRVLKEQEAINYLERLTCTMDSCDIEKRPILSLKSALNLELRYFQRLMRDPAKKELAVLGIASNGFPELPSLVLDVNRAYVDLETLEQEIGNSVYPLFQKLRVTNDLADYKTGIDKVMADFQQDQGYINALKELQKSAQSLCIERQFFDTPDSYQYDDRNNPNWGESIYTKPETEGLLFYDCNVKAESHEFFSLFGIGPTQAKIISLEYTSGYLKYIDLQESSPLLFISEQNYKIKENRTVHTDNKEYFFTVPKTRGYSSESHEEIPPLFSLIKQLSKSARQLILSVDFTEFSDEQFHEYVANSTNLKELLKHLRLKPQTAPTTDSKGWRRFLRS